MVTRFIFYMENYPDFQVLFAFSYTWIFEIVIPIWFINETCVVYFFHFSKYAKTHMRHFKSLEKLTFFSSKFEILDSENKEKDRENFYVTTWTWRSLCVLEFFFHFPHVKILIWVIKYCSVTYICVKHWSLNI